MYGVDMCKIGIFKVIVLNVLNISCKKNAEIVKKL